MTVTDSKRKLSELFANSEIRQKDEINIGLRTEQNKASKYIKIFIENHRLSSST